MTDDQKQQEPESVAAPQPDAAAPQQQEGQQQEQQTTQHDEKNAEQPAAAEGEKQDGAAAPKRKRGADDPVRLGYCVFTSAEQLVQYFRNLLVASPKNVDMNEYEHLALLGLLKQHPDADKKVGPGIRGFQVREINVNDGKARAFVAMRKDGSMEDFSYLKCSGQLYPGEVNASGSHKQPRKEDGGGHGGRGGNRGRGGRGGRGGGGGRRGGRR